MMGILIDIILIAIIILSAFLGYKKGLIKLGTKIFAGIIAIIVTIIIYKPMANIIINNTEFDEKIQSTIIENTEVSNNIENGVVNEILQREVENISNGVVYLIIGVLLFIFIKIILNVLVSFIDIVAKLPILKQFNEIGGIAYGLIRGGLIICIFIIIIGITAKINPKNKINQYINDSYLTKIIYNTIIKF